MPGMRKGGATEVFRSEPGQPPASFSGPMEAPTAVRLLILSDIRFLREGLADLLSRESGFVISGIAATLDETINTYRYAPPQITLIDAALPDGLAVTRSLSGLYPNTPIVALALAETRADVLAWAQAGISGYIPRTAALLDLVGFLGDIVRGEQVCSTRIAGGLLRWIARATRTGDIAVPGRPHELTAREAQVVRLICSGLSNKEISRRLNVGLSTTKSHVHNLLAKLELQRRGQVANWSRERPWVLRKEPPELG
jgi:DNA-binding NarL/FixJ family response regulator